MFGGAFVPAFRGSVARGRRGARRKFRNSGIRESRENRRRESARNGPLRRRQDPLHRFLPLSVRRGHFGADETQDSRQSRRPRERQADSRPGRHRVRRLPRERAVDCGRAESGVSESPLALRLHRARHRHRRGGAGRVSGAAQQRSGVHRRFRPRESRAHPHNKDAGVAVGEVPRRIPVQRGVALGRGDGFRRATWRT